MNISKITAFRIFIFSLLIFSVSGCSDFLSDPLKDKETGDDINLILVDFNFFTTRMTYKLKDATTGETITSDAVITFTGKNSDDIVTYTGEKNTAYQTSEGQLELTVDPNIPISTGNPFEFAININVNGYNPLSKGISIKSEGLKTFELSLVKTADEEETNLNGNVDFGDGDTTFVFIAPVSLKSAKMETKPYKINYSITLSSIMKFLDGSGNPIFTSSSQAYQTYLNDPEKFIQISVSTYSDYQPEIDQVNFNGTVKSSLFHKLETGKLTKLMVGGKTVANLNGGLISSGCSDPNDFLPQIMNFVSFDNDHWNLLGTNVNYNQLNFSYTLATVSEEDLCGTGSQINFKAPFNSTFSIDADVYDNENHLVTTMSFKGKFPESFVVENVPPKAVKMVFRNNNPAFAAIAPLEIDNFCTGNYDVNVSAADGYREYQVVLIAICPDNPTVAIAPTYSGEVRIKNSDDPWQGINMESGVVDILGKPNADYELRLLWENEWEYSSYATKFDAVGNYVGSTETGAKIKSKTLSDGRVQISVAKTFDQNICDDLNW